MPRRMLCSVALLLTLAGGHVFGQPLAKEVQPILPPLDFDRIGIADGLPQSNVQAMVQDGLGFLWLGTQDGLARYDGAKMRVFRPIEGDPTSISAGYITALALDESGKVWVGTDDKGVNVYDPETDQFTRFGRGAGLSSEGVNAIARDGKGRIWLAMTGGGLNKYDPATQKFVEFIAPPLDVSITSIDADPSGPLWLGTADKGVLRWNPDTGDVVNAVENITQVNTILASRKGTIWIGTEGEGLLSLDPASKKVKLYRADSLNRDSLSNDHVSTLFEDRNGAIWVGTRNGLNQLSLESGKFVQYHHDPNVVSTIVYPWVTSLYEDAGGVIWAGGKAGGVAKFAPLRSKFNHYRINTTANSFFEDKDGTLWVGTYHGGLFRYDWKARRVTRYRVLGQGESAVQLDSAWLSSLHRDRRGTLWITTLELGLLAFDSQSETFQQYRADDPDGLPVDSIWDIWEDDKGLLWLATWGGGLVRLDPETRSFSSITVENATGLTSNHLYQLYPDPKERNILWLGTAKGGLVRFDIAAGTGTAFRHRDDDPTSLSSDDVLSIHRDPDGSVWVGTYGGGLNRLDPATGKATRFTTQNSSLTSDVILGILPGDEGRLWLSTNGGGLLELDPKTAKFLVYETSDGVQDNEFGQGSFMRSKSGRLYFGGVGGFNAFHARDITRDTYAPPVVITGLKLFNQEVKLDRPMWTLPPVEVSYSDSFELQFAALAFAAPRKNRFAYKLEGFDDDFIETDRPFATYTKLGGGNYVLRVRAANRHGVWNETGIALKLRVTPPFWRTWPAYVVYVLLLAGAVVLLFYLQRQRVRRAEREGRLAVVERDLALTGAVQSGFLPEYNEIDGGRLRLFGFFRPAEACGGDWWWHEQLGSGKHIILVGDVTGHGPGPAMVTAAVATAFRVLIENGVSDAREALEVLNRVVLNVAKGKYHMTIAALELDEASGQWLLHSAGAPPIMTLNLNGKHKVHFCPGTPLGTESAFEAGLLEGRLSPSERILICTDGIPEIMLPNGNALGMRRLAQIYERTSGRPLRDAAAEIVQQADLTQSGKPQDDDWTFTIIEWR
jgi:ligand-binding sensor domain-containing protein